MSEIKISETEYKDLLACREMLMDISGIKKKIGPAYRRYMELKGMDEFFRTHYREQYKIMCEDFKTSEMLASER